MPHRLASPSGLTVEVNENGSLRRIDHADVVLNLFLGNEIEGGPANVFLRRRGTTIASTPLLGPASPGTLRVDADGLTVHGTWQDLRFVLRLVLAAGAPAWFWHLDLENVGSAPATVDVVYAQDLALAPYGAVRLNEYYVSQYVDYTPLVHPEHGFVLAVRQNLAHDGRHPWASIGSLGNGVGFATDALQFHGLTTRAGGTPAALREPSFPVQRRQHEHSMAVVQDAPVVLAPGSALTRGFFAWFEPDHPAVTTANDLAVVARALALPEAVAPRAVAPAAAATPAAATPAAATPAAATPAAATRAAAPAAGTRPAATLFSTAPVLACEDLDAAALTTAFGAERRHVEVEAGRVLSFFTGARTHVVLQEKEQHSLRPHGHLLRTGDQLVPDEASLTSTAWMNGVFHSLVTQGHVTINRMLSTVRSYLGLFRSGGLRIFIELADGHHLLGVPSAFAMTPSGCRWLYRHAGGVVQVESRAATRHHALTLAITVLAGPPRRFLLSQHVAFGGDDGAESVAVRWEQDADGIVIRTHPETDLGARFPAGFFRFDSEPGTAIERVAGDEALFCDGRSRAQPFLVVVTAPTAAAAFRLTAGLTVDPSSPAAGATAASDEAAAADAFWTDVSGAVTLHPPPGGDDVARVQEMLPWLAQNALVHYLAPRGLEQYSGGAWGTRDVCQGPVEMLLALDRGAALRDVLLRVFAAQNPDGDWPQWFGFFARDRASRAGDSHGDIVFWPLLALGQYLLASGDATVLDAVVPFFTGDDAAAVEPASIAAHVERALAVVAGRQIPDTSLVAYGHGDWNDSLQPVDPAMRERLCSSWTVTLQAETAHTLATALRRCGRRAPEQSASASEQPALAPGQSALAPGQPALASEQSALASEQSALASEQSALAPGIAALADQLDVLAARTRRDFQRLLIPGGTLAGFAYVPADGPIEYLLHPSDRTTGIHYRLLPMIHAIIDGLLTPEQARTHVELIRAHLLAPDGARLFDRPPQYRGGEQRSFQRAESSTYFGREIGLMYVHAHLRYAEAMATWGDAEAFYLALRQMIPIGLSEVVPNARRRQANTYASSSDAAFVDRYEAQERYDEVKRGAVPVDGGWRVYSSGAGIAFRLIHERLFGLRRRYATLTIDPVLPPSLDGLALDVTLAGTPVRVVYAVGERGSGPSALELNGGALPFEREANPYRVGGAVVAMATLRARLRAADNTLAVRLG